MDIKQEQLTTEQKFSLDLFRRQVEQMNREQAIAELIRLYATCLLREAQYRELLKKKWGYKNPPPDN